MAERTLLLLDGLVNLLLGLLLLAFPPGLVAWLGLPGDPNAFYPRILGAVLFGIGLALLIERRRDGVGPAGLGLTGAIAINVSGGLVLAGLLFFGGLNLSLAGYFFLGILAAFLLGLSGVEMVTARGVAVEPPNPD